MKHITTLILSALSLSISGFASAQHKASELDAHKIKRELFSKQRRTNEINLSKNQPIDFKKSYLEYTVPLLLKKVSDEAMRYPAWDLNKTNGNLALDKLKQLGPDVLPAVRAYFKQNGLPLAEYQACLILFVYFTDVNALPLMVKALGLPHNTGLPSAAHFYLKKFTGHYPQETFTKANQSNLLKKWEQAIQSWSLPQDHVSPHKKTNQPFDAFPPGIRSGPPAEWRIGE